jgi:hypothetical protein
MKAKRLIKPFLLLTLGISAVTNLVPTFNRVETPIETSAAESVASYYSTISDSLTGDSLKLALRELNKTKLSKQVTYNGFRQGAAYFDLDPDGSGKIIGFYNNAPLGPAWDSGKTWNREHVWPNSRNGDLVEDDAHMVSPTASNINSSAIVGLYLFHILPYLLISIALIIYVIKSISNMIQNKVKITFIDIAILGLFICNFISSSFLSLYLHM